MRPLSPAVGPAAVGPAAALDVDDLYLRLSPMLQRIVRRDVCAPEAVIEDACQVAWTRLVEKSVRVRNEGVLGWLATTAVREVFKLSRRQAREPSLEAALEEPDGLADAVAWIGCPERAVEASERIGALRALPERQQRLLWLQASGLSYGEISGQTGDTIRTVERQLHSARLALKAR